MLERLRQSAGSWMIKILLMVIVLAFVFMGAGSFMSNRSNEVATVNGESISIRDYQRAYQNITANLRNQFGDQLNDEMLKMFNVERQALDMLINKTLLLQVADENDMRVTEETLAESITRTPMFQTDGAFDPGRYELILSQNRLSPQEYEAMQKEAMLTKNVQDFVTNTVAVSESEAKTWYNGQNTQINVEYVVFKPSDFDEITVSEEEIQTYYDEHKADYKTEPKIKTRYIRFSAEDYKSRADISDEQIENYYNTNRSDYTSPETVSARHILLKVAENADPETVEEKRKAALDIAGKAREGEDFAELARTHSEGPTRSDGGDLGSFSRDDMVEPFSKAAFSLESGEISEPIRTQFGWHIIKVEDHQPEATKPLDSVREEIRARLAEQEAKNMAYDEALAVYDMSFDGEDLVHNAEDLGLEVETTGLFTKQNGPRDIADSRAFANAAFQLPLMEISDINEIGNSFYLIQVIEKEAAKIPELEMVHEQVAADARKEKMNQAAADAAESFLDKVKETENLSATAKEADREIKETGFFTRNETVPAIGQSRAFTSAAFTLTAENPLVDSVVRERNNLYILSFKGKNEPEPSDFEENREQTVDELKKKKKQQVFEAWLTQLKQDSEIKISNQFSKQFSN